jgi:ribose-phosphate pyrophosphokinase
LKPRADARKKGRREGDVMKRIIAFYGNAFGDLEVKAYPSGEPLVTFPPKLDFSRVLFRPASMLDLMGGLFFIDAYVERGYKAPGLILPFVPGARQDRLNDAGDFLFTAKSVAREINMRGFPRVTIIDPHSEVIAGLIDRCHVVHAHECIDVEAAHMPPYAAVISPDAGAEKRAGAVAKKLGIPMFHAWKTRDVATGAITGFGLEPIGEMRSPRALIVDDICDGGRTFVGLAAVLKERGIIADLYVTHGIFSQGTALLLEHYQRVYCTDSLDLPAGPARDNVSIIPICKRLLEGDLQ